MGDPTWDDVLQAVDTDTSGTVSWEELIAFVEEYAYENDLEISQEMEDELHAMFDAVDTDGSGEVDKAEFEAAIAAHGLGQKMRKKLSQIKSRFTKNWDEFLAMLDKDASGTVCWKEVEGFARSIELSDREIADIKVIFDEADTDGSGCIDKAEFEAAVKAYEEKHGLAQKIHKKLS